MAKKSTIVCKSCGLIGEPIITTIPLPTGSHKKAICSGCKKFIKFLPHSIPALYFGKYKGKTIAEIARKDPSYLQWMDSNNIGLGSVKTAIKEALACQK
ncbi:hypothetical protein [Candidatus Kuenenia sp.]|uniref:exodeoxyribonuclease X C-terminal domain-containing protein n=1 Tax=Candidatus Kuenenia sp. TaxID=2499824 RepID=UPI0032200F88